MKTATEINEAMLNEDASGAMIKALSELEASWNYVVKLWFDDEKIEDAMLKTTSVYPFGDNMDEIDIHKWIVACTKALKQK